MQSHQLEVLVVLKAQDSYPDSYRPIDGVLSMQLGYQEARLAPVPPRQRRRHSPGLDDC